MKNYTVIGLCECGCDNSFCNHTTADSPEQAETKVVEKRKSEDHSSRVIAIFEGHLENVCQYIVHPEG